MSDPVACPSGHDIPESAQFCPTCGASVKPVGAACPSGHALEPGQAFCPTCGSAASVPHSSTEPKPRRTPLVVAAAIVALLLVGVGAFLLIRNLTATPVVTAGNVASLLAEGGITCDDLSSVAAGQGSAEAELVRATLISCEVNGSDGEVDRGRSVGLFVADSAEDLGKVLKLSGICESEDNLTDPVAVGLNWIGSGQGEDPSAVLTQRLADALGGRVTTAGEFSAEVCESR